MIDNIYYMNLRDLQYLAAVASTRHFGRAAELCHVSQPTLSMQIRKLEDYLGITLLERGGREVSITPEGEKVLAHAHVILEQANAIRELAHQAGDAESGALSLGAIPTAAPYLLPKLLPLLASRLPRISVSLTEAKTTDLIALLKAGAIDAALVAMPLNDEAIEEHLLFREYFLLAVPSSHALAKKVAVNTNDLAGQEVMLLEDGHCFRNQALEVCTRAGARETRAFHAASLETLRELVASGRGITLVPAIAATPHAGIRYLPFSDPRPSRSIGLAWRVSTPRTALLQRICEILRGSS